MSIAYIGLGSNLDEPVQQLRAGINALSDLPQTKVLSCSSFYRTAPIGITDQPDFINAVCRIDTGLSALDLMRRLLDIEREHGRTRGTELGGPRTLDLDLLLFESEVVTTAELTLPHARMHERAFVLLPLAEIAPELKIPGRGPVLALLRACTGQRVERVESANMQN